MCVGRKSGMVFRKQKYHHESMTYATGDPQYFSPNILLISRTKYQRLKVDAVW